MHYIPDLDYRLQHLSQVIPWEIFLWFLWQFELGRVFDYLHYTHIVDISHYYLIGIRQHRR